MSKAKNIYSLIMWTIFTGLTGVLFIFATNDFVCENIISDNVYVYLHTSFIASIIIVASVLLALIIKKTSVLNNTTKLLFTALGFVIGLTSIIGYRVWFFNSITDTLETSGILNNYYDFVKIGLTNNPSLNFNNQDGIYNYLITFALRFLGYSGKGLYITEQIILILAVVLICFSVYMLLGGVEGFTYLLCSAFLPVFIIHGEPYSVYIIDYLSFAIGLFCIAIASKLSNINILNYFCVLISALIIGWIISYSDSSLVLTVMLVTLILTSQNSGIIYKISGTVTALIFTLISFLLTVNFDLVINNKWADIYSNTVNIFEYRFVNSIDFNNLKNISFETYFVVVLWLCIIYIAVYFINKYYEAGSFILVLFLTCLCLCYLPHISQYSSKIIIISLFSIISGSGISNLLGLKRKNILVESIDGMPVQNSMETEDVCISSSDITAESDDVNNDNIKDSGIELFEAPIPLPDRAPKRDFEYDYEVPEDLMHYDIEVFGEII